MAEPGQLVNPLIMRRGTTFYLPLRIDDGVNPLSWVGKEVRFQVKDNSTPNADCCDGALAMDISSLDIHSQIDLSLFTLTPAGTSPIIQGNFRLKIPGVAPDNDAGNSAGIELTADQVCQDTTFQIVVVTPGATAADSDDIDPIVTGRISIVGL